MPGKYRKGQSGNPSGRPKGIEDRRTEFRRLLEPHAPALIAKAVALALAGDIAALRLCIDRLVPPLRTADLALEVPRPEGTLADQGRAVLAEILAGRLRVDIGTNVIQALGTLAKLIESDELMRRIAILERGSHDDT